MKISRAISVVLLVVSALTVGVSAPAHAEVITGACKADAYGRTYAFNAGVTYAAANTEQWRVLRYEWTFGSSSHEDTIRPEQHNNVEFDLYEGRHTLKHVYLGSDTNEFGRRYDKLFTDEELLVKQLAASRVVAIAAFDKPGDPDTHCDVTLVFDMSLPDPTCIPCDLGDLISDLLEG